MNIGQLRDAARLIWEAALNAAIPSVCIRNAIQAGMEASQSAAGNLPLDGRLIVIGAGKASARMAQVVEEIFGDRIAGGLVVTKYGHSLPLPEFNFWKPASHPGRCRCPGSHSRRGKCFPVLPPMTPSLPDIRRWFGPLAGPCGRDIARRKTGSYITPDAGRCHDPRAERRQKASLLDEGWAARTLGVAGARRFFDHVRCHRRPAGLHRLGTNGSGHDVLFRCHGDCATLWD